VPDIDRQARPALRCAVERGIRRYFKHSLSVLKNSILLNHLARQPLTSFGSVRSITGRMFANERKRGLRGGEGVEEEGLET